MKDLKVLGISGRQQQMYTILLGSGISSASELSFLTGINRTTLYSNLEELLKMGLISEVIEKKKKYYQAIHPRSIKKLIQYKIDELKKVEENLPRLIEQYKSLEKKSKVGSTKTVKGRAGIPELIEQVAKSKTDIYFLGSIKGLQHVFGYDLMEKVYTGPRRRNLKIDDYLISDWAESTIRRFHQGLFSKIRFLPPDVQPRGCFVAYENKLVVGQLYPEPHAYVIEDETMVQIFKMSFILLWKDLEGKYIPPEQIDLL